MIQVVFGLTESKIRILKTWRAAATRGEKAVMAVRTSGRISECEWYNNDEGITFSSEDDDRDYKVEIDEDDTLCKLIFYE